jgi:hypothetical protein
VPAAPPGPLAKRDGIDTALKAVAWVAVGIGLLLLLGIIGSVFLCSMLVGAQ